MGEIIAGFYGKFAQRRPAAPARWPSGPARACVACRGNKIDEWMSQSIGGAVMRPNIQMRVMHI